MKRAPRRSAAKRPPSRRRVAPRPEALAVRARLAAAAFLERTDGAAEWQRADRALTLHMLERHAPVFFRRARLARPLDAAVAALATVPATFGPEVGVDDAMGRVDAVYLLRDRGLPAARPDAGQLCAYIEGVHHSHGPLFGWVFAELARDMGVGSPLVVPPRACRARSKLEDLYWLTHLVLFETRYLRRPLPRHRLASEVDELALAAPWVAAEGMLDLAAEIAFCLQAAGRRRDRAHRALVSLLVQRQRPDGSLGEPRALFESAESAARREAHCTAAALVALAGACG